ncbi:hypothetical protein Tco_1132368 [Tanacetum coccineum]|uniref:Transposase (Putative), gypsy type n=1 Tax=Tanacetum coccineum TaxID=301880 RepID=A0ABQ5JBQ7_9ASTR
MSFSKRPDSDFVCYTKPLDSLKLWNDHFFWVDSFSCPTSFPWHTDKNVFKDPFPKSTQFNPNYYDVLVAQLALFQKFLKPFLYLVGMSRHYTLDEETYPRFLHDDETGGCLSLYIVYPIGEAKLLDSIIGRVVSLLPVAPDRAKSELEASVEKLFDEGGSTEQVDSTAGGSHDAKIEFFTAAEDTTTGSMAAERLKRPRKKRAAATDASSSSHPLNKLRGDYRTSSEVVIGGRSLSVIKELLASCILSDEAGVSAMPTLPFVTSSVSAMPGNEDVAPFDSVTGANLCSIGLAVRFVISSDSSHHSSTNAPGAKVDSVIRSAVPPPVTTEAVITTSDAHVSPVPVPRVANKVIPQVQQSIFHESTSADAIKPDVTDPSHPLGKDLSLGSREVDFENLHEIRDIDYEDLFTNFNVGTARQACLSAEVRMQTEYCFSKRKRLESECGRQADLLKSRDEEVENLKAQLLLKENKAAEAARLRIQVSAFEAAEKVHVDELNILRQKSGALEDERDSLTGKVHALESTCSSLHDQVSRYEQFKRQIEEFQDARMSAVNEKVAKLDADLLEIACHLEERFYPHLLATISEQRWLLTHGMKLFLVKCLNSSDYLTALGAAISHTIEKGMQSSLAAVIDQSKERRSLTNSHKDASVEDIMNLLHLEGPLADAPGISDMQPDVKQLRVPIYRSEDQVVLGETSLSFSLSVFNSRVKRMRENIAAQRTSGGMPVATMTTTTLFTTFASASSIPPISTDDYEIVSVDGQEGAGVDGQGDAQGNETVEFEKEELDTTSARDPPS